MVYITLPLLKYINMITAIISTMCTPVVDSSQDVLDFDKYVTVCYKQFI